MSLKRKASQALIPVPRRNLRPRTQPYKYETLLPEEIRILVLHPGSRDDELRATLENVALNEDPEYKAISYAWGKPIFSETLHLPGGILNITLSLAGALRRFRDSARPVQLWADAVCIDQDTVLEKNHQVAQMADVYSCAKEVLIWLGEAEEPRDTFHVWAMFKLAEWEAIRDEAYLGHLTFASEAPFPPSGGSPWEYPCYDKRTSSRGKDWDDSICVGANDHEETCLLECPCCGNRTRFQAEDWDDIICASVGIFEKPWFSRLWVLQELHCAGEVAIFHCGNHTWPVTTLWGSSYFLQDWSDEKIQDFGTSCSHHPNVFSYHENNPGALLAVSASNQHCWLSQDSAIRDCLVVIYGAPMVFVFRPHGDGLHSVIGHAYLHGTDTDENGNVDWLSLMSEDCLEEITLI